MPRLDSQVKRGADFELFKADFLESGGGFFVDNLARDDDCFSGDGIFDGLATGASDDPGGKADNLLVALVDRANNDSVDGPAIVLGNDDILRQHRPVCE